MAYKLIQNGCELDSHFKQTLREKVKNLLDVSPLDATASSNIIKTKEGYLAVLQIFSAHERFKAEAVGSNVDEMLNSLSQKIYRQIRCWRNSGLHSADHTWGPAHKTVTH